MKRDIKSIAYALISKGFEAYIPEDRDYILINRLECSECHEQWFMNLNECFICGSFEPQLNQCIHCGGYISKTNASNKCPHCGQRKKTTSPCLNPDCLSNKNFKVKIEIDKKNGVFDRNNACFFIAEQNCIKCGSKYNIYDSFIIWVHTATSLEVRIDELEFVDFSFNYSKSYVLFRFLQNGELLYDIESISDLNLKSLEQKKITLKLKSFDRILEILRK